jgi:hypothetical protein
MSRAIAPRSRNGIEGHCDPVRDRMPFDDLQRSLQVVPAHRVSLVLDRGADGKQVTPDVIDVGQTSPGHVLVMVLDGARRYLAGLLLVEPRKRLGGLQGGDKQDGHGRRREHGASGQRWPDMRTAGKKPPAPSVPRRPDINALIAAEIYIALERLDAGPELLAIVGSWRDTLPDADVLRMLREHNAGRPTLHPRQ